MLDYHLHLWPHSDSSTPLNIEQIAAYCEKAEEAGVVELALTEHLFRFSQATSLLGEFWVNDGSEDLKRSMQKYWEFHARADLDAYVELALEAKSAGLPVVLGLEVDYYRGRMDDVAELLSGYPFDVLLGSVHWVGSWRFDVLDDPVSMNEWSVRDVDSCWDAYCDAIEELAESRTCDVMAHPDLIKVAGHRPRHPQEWWDRIAEAAQRSGMAAELSSAGWASPAKEQYPAIDLLARFAARGVPFTTASDAHGLSRVADRIEEMRSILESVGVDHLLGFRARQSHRIPTGCDPSSA